MSDQVTPETINVPDDALVYTPQEVGLLFRVDPKTVARWEDVGKLKAYQVRCTRTLGNHRRYNREDIDRMFKELMNK